MASIRTQVSGPVVMLWCDVGAALAIATAQGHDPRAMAWLLAHIAAGVDEAAAKRLEETARAGSAQPAPAEAGVPSAGGPEARAPGGGHG